MEKFYFQEDGISSCTLSSTTFNLDLDIFDKDLKWLNPSKSHMMISSGEEPYKCEICDKKFAQRLRLTHHLENYNNINHVHCEICKERFETKSGLKVHSRVHVKNKFNVDEKKKIAKKSTNIQPVKMTYNCDMCTKSYSTMWLRDRHRVSHTNPTPKPPKKFNCAQCSKSYSTKLGFQNHIENVHQLYKCEQCSRIFQTDLQLKVHHRMKRHSNVIIIH